MDLVDVAEVVVAEVVVAVVEEVVTEIESVDVAEALNIGWFQGEVTRESTLILSFISTIKESSLSKERKTKNKTNFPQRTWPMVFQITVQPLEKFLSSRETGTGAQLARKQRGKPARNPDPDSSAWGTRNIPGKPRCSETGVSRVA